MRVKRILSLLSVWLSLNIILSGCGLLGGSSNPGAYEEGVLRVWATWGDKPDQLQALFDRYSQETGQVVKVSTRVRSDKIEAALRSDTPPEIMILSSSELVGSYSEQGFIAPLEPWVETAGIHLDDFYPAPLARCELKQGTHLCLPWGGDVLALFWNKDLFKAAGLDPEQPPRTMEELADFAEKLTLHSAQGKLSQLGFVPDFPRSHTELYARMLGGAWLGEAGERLAANAQPVIDAETWQLQFFTRPGFKEANTFIATFDRYRNSNHPVYAGTRLNCQQCHRGTPPDLKKLPDNGFTSGKVAMMVDGEWQVGAKYIRAVQPDLNYGVAPFPPTAAHPERENTTLVQGAVVVMPAKGKDKAAAAKLLAWMMSPEIAAEAAYVHSSLPTSRTAAQDARFQQIPNFTVFMELMAHPNASGSDPTTRSPEINQALLQAERDLLHKKGGDPAALLNEIQTGIEP